MSTEEPDYLAVLRATYDYEPQSEDEISIKENQIVLLIERVDDDWWKVKIKGDSQDDETPVGLVPAAWLEQADHSSVVKAIYDYAASAPGELSISEDENLLAFGTEEEWMLVQSTKEDGKAGYVPANYVEPHNEEEEAQATPQVVVPPSPPRPVSIYVDPADRVASTKTNDVNDADQIKTWSVAEVDQKGKKMKGTLGIGKGAVFFASETSKAAVRRWPSADIVRVSVEKNKHLHIDIGGSAPTSLHFNVGSRDNVDAIKDKLQSSKAMSLPVSPPAEETSEAETQESNTQKGPKPSVHFSAESPVIIPAPDIDGDEVALDTEEESGESAVALYDFNADQSDELTIKEGEHLLVLEKDDEWWKCRNAEGVEGVVPASYVEIRNAEDAENKEEDEEQQIREEEAAAQAAAAQEAAQLRARQAQVQAAEAKKLKEAKEKEERARKEAEKRAKSEQKAKAAAEEERSRLKAQKEADQKAESHRKSSPDERSDKQNGRSSSDARDDRYRLWHDRTGQFSTEAVFLGFSDGKVSLRKKNGVVVYVPSERISAEDMRYIDKFLNRKRSSSRPQPSPSRLSEDDIPLGLQHPNPNGKSHAQPAPNRGPTIDWFDFFLSAGCDMNDCTRYAASFEKDKIDESILPDITDATMRSLGLREGDIIRVTKAIAARKPQVKNDVETQILRDEELAKRLDAEEKVGTKSPPNIFTGPGGALKPRRTRPTPSKTLPANVDLNLIGNISDRASSPQQASPANRPSSTPVQAPPRSSSAMATASRFEDDAWTNRIKPMTPTPSSSAAARPPSAPPAPAAAPVPVPAPQSATTPTTIPPVVASSQVPSASLAQTTEADIFNQLSRLSELRKSTPVVPSPSIAPVAPPAVVSPPHAPVGLQNGLGVGSSPSPIGQFLQSSQPLQQPSQPSPQPYNGPRGPFAPVPANQGLLQPLVPTQTGFTSFIPTRPNAVSPFQNPPSQPSFLSSQPSFLTSQPSFLTSQPTGFPGMQPILSQPTGLPFSGLQPTPNGFGQVATNATGFNPHFGQTFNNVSSVPPVPPIPSPAANSTNPANIFAQMKSGTFATDHESTFPQTAENYDALRPNPLIPQPTSWGTYGYR